MDGQYDKIVGQWEESQGDEIWPTFVVSLLQGTIPIKVMSFGFMGQIRLTTFSKDGT